MAKLAAVQVIRRAIAEEALAAARTAEAEARAREEAAVSSADAARGDWLDCLARPGFAPELWRALAVRLSAREALADDAAKTTQASADLHMRRQDDWRVAEARTASTEARHMLAKRDAARHREESRLNDVADRVTRARWRP